MAFDNAFHDSKAHTRTPDILPHVASTIQVALIGKTINFLLFFKIEGIDRHNCRTVLPCSIGAHIYIYRTGPIIVWCRTMYENVDGFVYECKHCGLRFFQEGKPASCCGHNDFVRMTIEKALGVE
jgi:hypothetical protein